MIWRFYSDKIIQFNSIDDAIYDTKERYFINTRTFVIDDIWLESYDDLYSLMLL